ncbi:MAG: PadR family transcriptional regulator [Thermoprotei archaeon]
MDFILYHAHGGARGRDAWRVKGLRWWILSALTEGPKNGAEVAGWIEARSDGLWRPSPGSLYPMLAQLCEEGLIKKCEDSKYRMIVGAGPSFWRVVSSPMNLETAVNEVESYASYIEDMQKLDSSKIQLYRERIKKVAERLAQIAEG